MGLPPERNRRDGRAAARAAVPAEDDALLAARVATGDRQAYAGLVDRHLPRVLAVARRMLGDDAAAEDAAQDILLKLWTHAARYDPGKALLSTWLTRIAVNLCLDRLRKKREDQLDDDFEGEHPAEQHRALMAQELAGAVDEALQRLPERQRLAVVLCHYEGLSMKEAADMLETSVEAVESLLARARRGLKVMLAPHWRALLPDEVGG